MVTKAPIHLGGDAHSAWSFITKAVEESYINFHNVTMSILTVNEVTKMGYVELLARINEINRPPGGKDSIRRIVRNTFLTKESKVLDVGCNTGYSTFEIAHLIRCHVTGVDISSEMIKTALRFKGEDLLKENIDFQVADGMNLPFESEAFDLTMSGGSTAFIDDKRKALKEYARVTKRWGFIADINFFYKSAPPVKLIERLNKLMGIEIQPWQKQYWQDVYKATGLEIYYTHYADVYVPSKVEIQKYCEQMSISVDADTSARALIKGKLEEIMTLFAENHKYLAYGVFVLRKRDKEEQVTLFGA